MSHLRPAATYTEVETPAAIEAAIGRSSSEPVVLFMFDPWCGANLSARAAIDRLPVDVLVVDVHRHHDLGRVVEVCTGVPHESPQVIVLRDRQPAWHASHGSIRTSALAAALGLPDP